jgi:N-methylhydantoinase A/oxoprolinase/acetone carboxylase beta subunit
MLRVGVDVGGTNTDSVVMAGRDLRGWAKAPTSADVTQGIVASLREALAASGAAPADVGVVMIGTTHFTNAIVERRGLAPTAVVRLGLPATASVEPFDDWPDDLRAAVDARGYLTHGGYEFDGRTISDLDVDELARIGRDLAQHGTRAVGVCGVFSPIRPDHEQQAAAILTEHAPRLRVSLSQEIGRLGLLERENATALNACLSELADHTVGAIEQAIRELGLHAPVYLSQNDGTLMSADFVRRYPVLTFASGPTNSMRGAAYLTGLRDALVIDIGGTTSDIGMLTAGFPREAGVAVPIGGVRTNFRMPDLLTLGLGGGSRVRLDPLRVGPDSVGFRLTEQALVFGGSTLTASDAAVAAGRAALGDPRGLTADATTHAPAVMQRIRQQLADAIDQVKTSSAPVPVILVGGGSILVGDDLPGASAVIRPPDYQVANAIGAAIAQVSGEVDHVRALDDGATRASLLEAAQREATARAVEAGALADTVTLVEAEDVPLAYLPGGATRVRVKVVGDLQAAHVGS